MFELSEIEKQNLIALTETTDFQFAVVTLQLYASLEEDTLDADTLKALEKFFVCEHNFESYAYLDNGYDDSKSYYVICTGCKALINLHYAHDGTTGRSVIVNGDAYADF